MRHALRILLCYTAAAISMGATSARAEWSEWSPEPDGADAETPRRVTLDAELLTVGLMFNDRDFDRTVPAYNANRQHVGVVGTLLRPGITFHVLPTLRIRYQAEVGLNVWSRNNADQLDPTAGDIFLLLHRQVYAEGGAPCGKVGFKAGFDRWTDPSMLMMAHWTGAVRFRAGQPGRRFVAEAGLLPDATYEGWQIIDNNFTHDTFFARFGGELGGPEGPVAIEPGALLLVDGTEVGRRLTLAAPYARVVFRSDKVSISLEAMGQLGTHTGAALDGTAERQAAWAVQLHGDEHFGPITLNYNVLALSPDDAAEGNGFNGAFRYSGLSRSRTLWLSENELFDTWNNLDERLGTRANSHFLMRMGLLQADLRLAYRIKDVFEPAIIAGVAGALRPANALGKSTVGVETDLDLAFHHPQDVLSFHAIASVLVPGGAAAAAINQIDRDATDVIFGGMLLLDVRFR